MISMFMRKVFWDTVTTNWFIDLESEIFRQEDEVKTSDYDHFRSTSTMSGSDFSLEERIYYAAADCIQVKY